MALLAAVALVLALLATGAVALPGTADDAPGAAVAVGTTDPVTAPDATATAVAPSTAGPSRVRLPSLGLDAGVQPISAASGELDPPGFADAYWISEYGRPDAASPDPAAADNTVYLVGHSARRGTAVFDPLVDRASQGSTVAAGDEVVVTTPGGDLTYVVDAVDGVHHYPKGELAAAEAVWAVVPGRLVLITCLQRADGRPSTDNLVVTATLRR